MPRLLPLLLLLVAARARAYDEFDDRTSDANFVLHAGDSSLTLKGELEVELHDLEGKGGPGHDSPTDTRTIGTRSPFVEIDQFWLAPRLQLGPYFAVYAVLEFEAAASRVGAAWCDVRVRAPDDVAHHLEVGYNAPFIKLDRRSERYPLIGTIYWREPEMHAAYDLSWASGELRLQGGLSVAMTRPLGFSAVQESSAQRGTVNVLAYRPGRVYSGTTATYGAKLFASYAGVFAEAFAMSGRLADEAGTDELRLGFANYQFMPGEPRKARAARFAGGRVGYEGFGVHAWAEAIASQEGLLERRGGYAQLSYELVLRPDADLFHTIEPLLRYETYRLRDGTRVQPNGIALRSPALSEAPTWDFEVVTAAVKLSAYRRLVSLRLEYYWVAEHNGVRALGIPATPFKNDELLAQVEVRF
jgi:hypothetical protein